MRTQLYRLHGLTFASEIDLPELEPAPEEASPEVRVELGEVPARLAQTLASGPLWMAGEGQFLLDVPEVARYLALDGNRVRIEPASGAAPGDIRLYLLGTVLGALMHQRGLLVLHAGAVEVNGQAMAFAGPSGAGKSTLVAHLRQRGYRLIGDDMLPISLDAAGMPWAQPGFARIKLWQDALRHLHHDPEHLVRDHSRLEKFHLRVESELREAPLPLARVFVLSNNVLDEDIRLEPFRGLDGVLTLVRASYKPRHVKGMGLGALQFQTCSRVASRAPVLKLVRPKVMARLEEVMDRLEAAWGL